MGHFGVILKVLQNLIGSAYCQFVHDNMDLEIAEDCRFPQARTWRSKLRPAKYWLIYETYALAV